VLTPLTSDDPRRIGPFRVANRIGAGGMGVVYLGFGEDGKPAAVKVPSAGLADSPEFRSRFRQEVDAARRVRGSSVAAVLDADPSGERPWMATEYVEGRSLADAVATRGALDDRLVHGLAIGLADALVAIHAAGVVHRDLKPANILLAWDGPKVIDFGIARAADSTSHTRTGMLIGTLIWMAPEQLRGDRAGPAADVFAWGACVAFAAAGRPPFRGERAEAIGMQILTAEPDLDGVPSDLVGLVHAALAKEPEQRPSATALLEHLLDRNAGSAAESDQASETALAQIWNLPPTPPDGSGPALPGGRPAAFGAPGYQPGTAGRRPPTSPAGGYPLDATRRDSRAAHQAPGYDDRGDGTRGYDDRGYGDRGYGDRGYGGPAGRGAATPGPRGGPGYDGSRSAPAPPYSDPRAAGPGYGGQGGGWGGTSPGQGDPRGGGSGQHRGVLVAAVVALLLVGGGIGAAVALSGGDGGGEPTATSTVSFPPGTQVPTTNPTAPAGTAPPAQTASAPVSSPTSQSPSPTASATSATMSADDAAAVVRSNGYEPDMGTYVQNQRLSVVIGTGQTAADGTPRQKAFVFAEGRYLGTDTKDPSAHVSLLNQPSDHEVTLRYDTYNPQDPIGSPSGHADVRYRWTGTNFSTLDPIPSTDPQTPGSRR
jgi:hypothetical protein